MPGASSTTSIWRTLRRSPPKRWPGSVLSMQSRTRSAESPLICDECSARRGPGRYSIICANGWRRRFARSRRRARLQLRFDMRSHAGGALTRYTEDGLLEDQRPPAERPSPLPGRKNFLFAGSDHGGERAAAMYTLIGSAKLNGLDPELYLRTVLAQIADHPISHIQDLLPWNLAPSLQTHSSQAA